MADERLNAVDHLQDVEIGLLEFEQYPHLAFCYVPASHNEVLTNEKTASNTPVGPNADRRP